MPDDKLIRKEKRRLLREYKALPPNKLAVVLPLIDNAAWMRVALDELRVLIDEEGFTEEYKNGKDQYCNRVSANVQSYNAIVKNFTSITNKLEGMLPPKEKASKLDAFMSADEDE